MAKPKLYEGFHDDIALDYARGMSATQLAKKYKLTSGSVMKSLRQQGVQIRTQAQQVAVYRKYQVVDDYFESVQTEEQAYWLGFITADGGIVDTRVSVAIHRKDASHLLKLRDALSPAQYLYEDVDAVRLSVSSTKLVEDLGRLGVTPRKSHTVQPWNGPAHLMPHYYRGIVDGDGCITKSNKWAVELVGSIYVVSGFAEYVQSLLGTRPSISATRSIWRTRVQSRHAVNMLCRLLYQGATVYLPRKKKLADEAIAETSAYIVKCRQRGAHP